jgi:hypothetical protein
MLMPKVISAGLPLAAPPVYRPIVYEVAQRRALAVVRSHQAHSQYSTPTAPAAPRSIQSYNTTD